MQVTATGMAQGIRALVSKGASVGSDPTRYGKNFASAQIMAWEQKCDVSVVQ